MAKPEVVKQKVRLVSYTPAYFKQQYQKQNYKNENQLI